MTLGVSTATPLSTLVNPFQLKKKKRVLFMRLFYVISVIWSDSDLIAKNTPPLVANTLMPSFLFGLCFNRKGKLKLE